jgi:RNA polymerase sigma-70 factor (ECF subfamily)
MSRDVSPASSPGQFPTTAWTFLAQVQQAGHAEHARAVNEFIARYWKPVFVFLRARGYKLHQAEDLTQEFFLRFLRRNWIRRASRGKGRFRSFLLRNLVRFLSDQGPGRARRQQAFEQQVVAVTTLLGDEERSYEPPAGDTPETVFMKQWAADLVATVRRRLQDLCATKGRATWYAVFDAAHAAMPDAEDATQEALAARFRLTRDQVRYALGQVRQWFVVLLRAEVRDQVGSEAEVDEEIRDLLALLGR